MFCNSTFDVIAKKILVAPLNWGLGHATRCIPIINKLIEHSFQVCIASDGVALELLRKEFPDLPSFELPSYNIKYAEKGKHFKIRLLWDSPKVLKAIAKEKKAVKKLVKQHGINGIVSDNRLGVYYKKVACVFITHQLNVLSGNTTWFSSKMHQKIIKKFDACWVPDVEGKPNLSGKLGHLKNPKKNLHYLGPLSRFEKKEVAIRYDLMVLLSGPEPQRTFLEDKLFDELHNFEGNVLLVKGKIEPLQHRLKIKHHLGNIDSVNFMQSKNLEDAINQSALVLCRSGYTTVMDLAKLQKKAFFIPTPGQYEQEYLAKRLQKQKMVPFSTQEDFKISDLKRVQDFTGLKDFDTKSDWPALFSAFSNVKENSEPTSSSLST